MRYCLCFVLGVVLGTAVTATAAGLGPRLVGENGYLYGFDVKSAKEKVCRDPWIWIDPGGGSGTIECK